MANMVGFTITEVAEKAPFQHVFLSNSTRSDGPHQRRKQLLPCSRVPACRGSSDDSPFAQPLALCLGQAEAGEDVFGVFTQLWAALANTARCTAQFG